MSDSTVSENLLATAQQRLYVVYQYTNTHIYIYVYIQKRHIDSARAQHHPNYYVTIYYYLFFPPCIFKGFIYIHLLTRW